MDVSTGLLHPFYLYQFLISLSGFCVLNRFFSRIDSESNSSYVSIFFCSPGFTSSSVYASPCIGGFAVLAFSPWSCSSISSLLSDRDTTLNTWRCRCSRLLKSKTDICFWHFDIVSCLGPNYLLNVHSLLLLAFKKFFPASPFYTLSLKRICIVFPEF